jgi:hypothetical protein
MILRRLFNGADDRVRLFRQSAHSVAGNLRTAAASSGAVRVYSKLYLYFNKLNFTAGALLRMVIAFARETRQMSTAHSVAQVVAQTAAELDDAFDISDPVLGNVYFLHARRPVKPKPTTLAECVPLLTIAIEFVRRGPDDLTIEAIEAYRTKAMALLADVKPVIETRANLSLEDWAAAMIVQPEIARSLT